MNKDLFNDIKFSYLVFEKAKKLGFDIVVTVEGFEVLYPNLKTLEKIKTKEELDDFFDMILKME